MPCINYNSKILDNFDYENKEFIDICTNNEFCCCKLPNNNCSIDIDTPCRFKKTIIINKERIN